VSDSSHPSVQSTALFETELKFTPLETKVEQNNVDQKFMLANYAPSKVEDKTMDYTKPTTLSKPAATAESTNTTTIDHATIAKDKTVVALKVPSTNDGIAITKQIRPEQKSANLFRQALSNIQQGRVAEAQEALSQALEANPANQEARQTLAGLLLDSKHNDEAKTIIAAGLAIAPEQSNFRMVLARLQVETGDRTAALNTLEQGQVYAKNNADYQSFYATLLQRADRHEEAINHYNTSLALNSGSASSLIGLGISLEATGKLMSARDAFTRAQNLATLSPELAQFADQRLKQINQHLQSTASK
jgi:MSHA biogenesis protein MshN